MQNTNTKFKIHQKWCSVSSVGFSSHFCLFVPSFSPIVLNDSVTIFSHFSTVFSYFFHSFTLFFSHIFSSFCDHQIVCLFAVFPPIALDDSVTIAQPKPSSHSDYIANHLCWHQMAFKNIFSV